MRSSNGATNTERTASPVGQRWMPSLPTATITSSVRIFTRSSDARSSRLFQVRLQGKKSQPYAANTLVLFRNVTCASMAMRPRSSAAGRMWVSTTRCGLSGKAANTYAPLWSAATLAATLSGALSPSPSDDSGKVNGSTSLRPHPRTAA